MKNSAFRETLDVKLDSGPRLNAQGRPERRIVLESVIAFSCLADLFALVGTRIVSNDLYSFLNSRLFVPSSFLPIASLSYFSCAYILSVYSRKNCFKFGYVANRVALSFFFALCFFLLLGAGLIAVDAQLAAATFFWMLCALGGGLGMRYAVLRHMKARLAAGDYVEKAVSIGVFSEPISAETIRAATESTVKIAHILQLDYRTDLPGSIDRFLREEIDRVYISVPWVDAPLILQQLAQLRRFSTRIFVIPREARIQSNHLGIGAFDANVAIAAVDRPIGGWGLWSKRLLDIIVASLLILAILPMLIAIGVAVKLESPGPVFFRQRREGFNGNYFELWKFRSMHTDFTDFDAVRQTSREDPRVTRVGKIIRKTSLDELPQLLNVLQGDMSIVGPRPHASQTRAEGRALADIAEQYAARHRVKPGLTGWAQVNGLRGELDTLEKVRSRVAHDIEYIENWSILLDVKIIFRTALLVFRDPAAF